MIYIIGLAYAAASPLILPVVLLYSVLSWLFWRYAGALLFQSWSDFRLPRHPLP